MRKIKVKNAKAAAVLTRFAYMKKKKPARFVKKRAGFCFVILLRQEAAEAFDKILKGATRP